MSYSRDERKSKMNSYKVTYDNGKSQNSVIVKARSLESARMEEQKAVAMFQRMNPAIKLVSVEVA
jgi:hypothetical protein